MEAEGIICRLDSVNNDIKKFNAIKFALKMTTFFIFRYWFEYYYLGT